ncbi:DUF445 domain-containing protein [Tersicoccus sp. Bi-70]|uniref:DUF445 domain-containing protein n=1 Tax=Tersicoccus sp. Bi-70 TaxID=1897634 RepID=UPI0009775847|nr:DUF445 domain-containing protein [Tersicoccus sp. Bi-70]OMH32336.1 hypothetical protein BGP79_07875 [Tersicoccus sp. Bi-70]
MTTTIGTPTATDPVATPGGGDAARAAGLRRMKTLALSLLIALAVVFLVAFALQGRYPWLQYVRAAAEGGMVGALADWFAVTALFKRPMGLPIPHTAIIPRRKDAIGASLGEFVESNFLSEPVVREKLAAAHVSRRAGGWLVTAGEDGRTGAQTVTAEGAVIIRGALTLLKDEDVAGMIESMVRRHVIDPPWGPPLGRVAHELFVDGHHRPVVDMLVDRAEEWLDTHQGTVIDLVTERSPSWVPSMIDGVVGYKVHSEVLKFVRAVQADPQHQVRRSIDDYLLRLADDMQHDPAMMARVDRIKENTFDDPRVRGFAATAWEQTKAALLAAVSDPDSDLSRRFTGLVTEFGQRLCDDDELAGKVDGWLGDTAAYLVRRYRHEAASIITDTVERWDGEETSAKIELAVGKDLQFIRINGTVVGSLAGLAIFAVAHAVFG